MARFTVSNEDLNSYGFWVETAGIQTDSFLKNPICLWNHIRGWRGTEDEILPIGVWKDLKVDNTEMSAEPEFDMEDEFAAKIGKKVDKGHLKACSIGIRILEWSDDPAKLKAGQTRPTVTKCELMEISIVDIPSNKSATVKNNHQVVFYDAEGNILNLSEPQVLASLPSITKSLKQEAMNELQTIALSLGLAQTATLAEVQAKIGEVQKLQSENVALQARINSLEKAQKEARGAEVKALLDEAIKSSRITAEQRPAYEKLFDLDFESAKTALAAIPAPASILKFTAAGNEGNPGASGKVLHNGKTFGELRRDNPDELSKLKASNPELFKLMYKQEYGTEYKD